MAVEGGEQNHTGLQGNPVTSQVPTPTKGNDPGQQSQVNPTNQQNGLPAREVDPNEAEEQTSNAQPDWLPQGMTVEQLEQKIAEHKQAPTADEQKSDGQQKKGAEEKPSEEEKAKEGEEKKEKEKAKEGEEKKEKEKTEEEKKKNESINDAFGRWNSELAEKGQLSEDTYKEIQDRTGFSKEIIDQYIADQQAANTARAQQFYDALGGQETYNAVLNWAEQNMPDQYNSLFDGSQTQTMEQAMFKLQGMKTQYERAQGAGKGKAPAQGDKPNISEGDAGGSVESGEGYNSVDQMVQDMSDPRYESDPQFRKQVEDKLARSPGIVING